MVQPFANPSLLFPQGNKPSLKCYALSYMGGALCKEIKNSMECLMLLPQ